MIDPKEFYKESGEITPEAWEGLNSDKDMEPHELRIGNIIAFEDGSTDIVRVAGIRRMAEYPETWIVDWDKISGNGSFDNGNSVVEEFIGVPLTPDILEACGFEKDGFNAYNISISPWPNTYLKQLSFAGDYLYLREGDLEKNRLRDSLCVLWNNDLRGKMFLHQLQNLFFALTGTKLTVNLDKVKV